MGGGLLAKSLHTAKSLKHTKVSTRVEFFRNIFKMENIYPKLVLPLNRQINTVNSTVLKFKNLKFCHTSLHFLKIISSVFNTNLNFRLKSKLKNI